jgi:hypothetical protein
MNYPFLRRSVFVYIFLFVGQTISAQKILDAGQLTATSTAAYSIRQLKTTYSHSAITAPSPSTPGFGNSSTPLIRVRRSSDNHELDLGYLASGELDTVTLLSFVGAGNGFVSIWYDQSGNSRDVTSATTNLPRIVNSGVIERSNDKPSIRFISGASYSASTILTRTVNATTLFNSGLIGSAMAVFEASSGNASAWGFGNGSNRWQIHANEGGGLKFDYGNTYQRTAYINSQNEGTLKNYAFIAPSGQGGQIWVNGVLVSTGQTPSSPCSGTLFEIGGIAQFNNWNHNNHQSELILFNSALGTNDRSAVSDDQAAFFLGIYIWSGATNSDYSVSTNWKSNSLPSVENDIYISALATNPLTVSNTYQVRNMTVEAGATVTLDPGSNIQVSGNIIMGGTFTGSGVLTLNGSSSQNLGGDNGVYAAVTIDNAAGVVLPGSTTFNGLLTFNSGSLDISNSTTNPVVITTININGGVSGSSVSTTIKGSNQTDLVWGGAASGTLFFDQSSNNNTNALRNLTVTGTQAMTLGSNLSIVSGDVTINSNAILDLQTFAMNRSTNGGTLTINGTLQLGGNTGGQTGSNFPSNFNSFSMSSAGIVEYNGSNAITQRVYATTYSNLKLSNGSGSGDAAKNATGNIIVNTGSFWIDALTTFTPATGNTVGGTGTITGIGTVVTNRTSATTDFNTQYSITTKSLSALTVEYSSASAQTVNNTSTYGHLIFTGTGTKTLGGSITVNGDITINSGATFAASTFNASLGGNWVNNGTYTPGSSSSTTIFNGVNQVISGTTATTFHALTISSSGSTTLNTNITLDNVSNANLTISAGSIFDLGVYTANRTGATGTRTFTINGTLKLGADAGGQTGSNFPLNFSTPTIGNSGVVEYNGANDITQIVYATSYKNLLLSNGSGTGSAFKMSTASFAVNTGNFTVNPNVQFTPSATNIISGSGTLTGFGAIDVTHSSGLVATQYTLNRVLTNLTVTVGNSSSTINGGTYSNLTLTRSGDQVLQGSIVVTGNLVVSNGARLDPTNSGYTITLAGNFVNNGSGLRNRNSAAIIFNGLAQTVGGSSNITFPATVINAGSTVSLLKNITLRNDLTINAGGTLDIGTNSCNRNTAGGALIVAGTLKIGGATNFPANFNTITTTSGTIDYNGLTDVTQTISTLPTYNNLTLSNGSEVGDAAKISSGNFTVNGTFRIDSLTTFTPAAADIVGGTGILNGNGSLIVSRTSNTKDLDNQYTISTKTLDSLTVDYNVNSTYTINPYTYGNLIISGGGTKTMSGTIAVNGDITISAGTFATGNHNISIKGNWINNSTFTAGIGAVTFNGVNQTISGSSQPTFHLLTINTTGTATLARNISIANASGATLTVSSGATLDLGTYTANAAGGTRSLVVQGILRLGNNSGGVTGSNFPSNMTPTLTGGTVEYYRSNGGQTISSATYHNLYLNNTSGTQTAGGNLTINGQLSINGTTLNMNTFTLAGASLTTAGTGTIQTQNTSGTPLPSGRTWTYSVVYNSGSSQTIVNGNYENLSASGGDRTLSSSGSIGIAGTFTTGTGTYTVGTSTVDFNGAGVQTIPAMSYYNLTVSGARVGSPSLTLYPGTINIAGNFNNTATGIAGYFTSGSTVNYNGATQTVAGFGYGKLVISGTGLKTLGGSTTVNDSLTVGGSAGLNGSSYTLTILGPWVNNAAFTGNSGTVNFAGLTSQTISGSTTPNFNGLTINNSNGVTMATAITVLGTLALTNGKLFVGSNTLTLNGALSTSANNSISANGLSNITMGGVGNTTLFLDQTTPNTTNTVGTFTVNRTGNTITLGNDMKTVTALNILSGKLAIGSNLLTISGSLSTTASNCLVGSGSSNLAINGSGALGSNVFLDQSVPGTTNRLNNITYNRSSQTITLGDTIEIAGIITPTAGTLATSNKLKLISNVSGTARVASGSGNYISGNVIAERFIPSSARRWRFLGAQVSGATLADLKGETYITGPGGASHGFDATLSNFGSVYTYDETDTTGNLNSGWVGATNITDSIVVGKGFRIFIRGDRSDTGRLNGNNATQNAVTLNLVGPLNKGDINIPVSFSSSGTPANDGWNLVSNPYASPIDWNAFHDAGRGGTTPNFSGADYTKLNPTIYIYNAATGSYVSFNAVSNAGTGSLSTGIIPSGAAFWVKAEAVTPSMTMKESYKTSASPAGVFKTGGNQFTIKLIGDSINSDEIAIKYIDDANTGFDGYDIKKLAGGEVDIASMGSDGSFLSVNCRPFMGSDTILLNVGFAKSGTYTMQFDDISKLGIGAQYQVSLVDLFTKRVSDLGAISSVEFAVDKNDSNSFGNKRFILIIGETISTGVSLLEHAAKGMYVYPSVTADRLRIYSRENVGAQTELTLVDQLGKKICLITNPIWDGNKLELDLSTYASGTYFIQITQPNQPIQTLRCIKQ